MVIHNIVMKGLPPHQPLSLARLIYENTTRLIVHIVNTHYIMPRNTKDRLQKMNNHKDGQIYSVRPSVKVRRIKGAKGNIKEQHDLIINIDLVI